MTRAVFLGTLSALDSVLITALDSNSTASSLIDFSFDTAHTEGSRVLPIEQCACPEGYSGSSCDQCSTGYYRLNGACAPCACNGRSSTCQDNTGVCTVSPPTQYCLNGYYCKRMLQNFMANILQYKLSYKFSWQKFSELHKLSQFASFYSSNTFVCA